MVNIFENTYKILLPKKTHFFSRPLLSSHQISSQQGRTEKFSKGARFKKGGQKCRNIAFLFHPLKNPIKERKRGGGVGGDGRSPLALYAPMVASIIDKSDQSQNFINHLIRIKSSQIPGKPRIYYSCSIFFLGEVPYCNNVIILV